MRALIIMVVALVAGLAAVFLAKTMVDQQVSTATTVERVNTVPVVIAKTDLKMGTRLDKLMLDTIDWPETSLPENHFRSIDSVLGDAPPIVLKDMKKGEVVLHYKLSPHGAKGGLPAKIPEDMRAITIAVTEVRGVAGFVLPGNYVDVLHTTSVGRKDGKPVNRVLMQNVQVLGVDQLSSEDETKPTVVNAVTLLVNTADGQKLTLASTVGELNLLLRNEYDASILEVKTLELSDLVPTEAPTKVRVYKRVRRPTVEVIRGLEIKTQSVSEGKELSPATTTPSPAQ
ncbi:MAG: Flp pilus assembly protein CpaB [Gammaproteobacteria bacterium]|nr:Flp pilus assembly protein CpaB [Gammaproteobacteria bacterium]